MMPPTTPLAVPDTTASKTLHRVPWPIALGLFFVIAIFFMSQLVGGLVASIYPLLKHWTKLQTTNWLTNSVLAQFIFVLVAELTVIAAVYWFLKLYKRGWSAIGLHKPQWRDLAIGLAAVIPYYLFFVITVSIASKLAPSLNVTQQQQIGFTNVHGVLPLIVTFISLAILPPLTEEILVRGFLYTTFRKGLPVLWAAIITSLVFASAHLPEGGAAGPLYIAAIDTFVLSMVLVYLREKTSNLWAGITLHAVKNGVAFCALFIFHMS